MKEFKYRLRMWSDNDNFDTTKIPIIDHYNNNLERVKELYKHWISQYFGTEMNANRYIIVTEEQKIIAFIVIHFGGKTDGGWAKWE